uniref:Transmembrane protein 45B n=1 Tax=Terrapene triunguis TaxID=2587831 RepID=A0A674I7X4_9SAUR
MLTTWQHTTMYLFFGISGTVDVLTYFYPLGLDRFVFSQAMFVEGFLFHFHVRNRSALQQHVHLLLIVALCGDALSLHLEVFVPHHPRPISFVLYPPGGWPDWDQMDDGNIMFSTRCVCWHYVAALIIVVFNYTIVFWHEGVCHAWLVLDSLGPRTESQNPATQDCSLGSQVPPPRAEAEA